MYIKIDMKLCKFSVEYNTVQKLDYKNLSIVSGLKWRFCISLQMIWKLTIVQELEPWILMILRKMLLKDGLKRWNVVTWVIRVWLSILRLASTDIMVILAVEFSVSAMCSFQLSNLDWYKSPFLAHVPKMDFDFGLKINS